MSAPARKVVIYRVEVCGTIATDTPSGELLDMADRIESVLRDELAGQLGGLSVEIECSIDATEASS